MTFPYTYPGQTILNKNGLFQSLSFSSFLFLTFKKSPFFGAFFLYSLACFYTPISWRPVLLFPFRAVAYFLSFLIHPLRKILKISVIENQRLLAGSHSFSVKLSDFIYFHLVSLFFPGLPVPISQDLYMQSLCDDNKENLRFRLFIKKSIFFDNVANKSACLDELVQSSLLESFAQWNSYNEQIAKSIKDFELLREPYPLLYFQRDGKTVEIPLTRAELIKSFFGQPSVYNIQKNAECSETLSGNYDQSQNAIRVFFVRESDGFDDKALSSYRLQVAVRIHKRSPRYVVDISKSSYERSQQKPGGLDLVTRQNSFSVETLEDQSLAPFRLPFNLDFNASPHGAILDEHYQELSALVQHTPYSIDELCIEEQEEFSRLLQTLFAQKSFYQESLKVFTQNTSLEKMNSVISELVAPLPIAQKEEIIPLKVLESLQKVRKLFNDVLSHKMKTLKERIAQRDVLLTPFSLVLDDFKKADESLGLRDQSSSSGVFMSDRLGSEIIAVRTEDLIRTLFCGPKVLHKTLDEGALDTEKKMIISLAFDWSENAMAVLYKKPSHVDVDGVFAIDMKFIINDPLRILKKAKRGDCSMLHEYQYDFHANFVNTIKRKCQAVQGSVGVNMSSLCFMNNPADEDFLLQKFSLPFRIELGDTAYSVKPFEGLCIKDLFAFHEGILAPKGRPLENLLTCSAEEMEKLLSFERRGVTYRPLHLKEHYLATHSDKTCSLEEKERQKLAEIFKSTHHKPFSLFYQQFRERQLALEEGREPYPYFYCPQEHRAAPTRLFSPQRSSPETKIGAVERKLGG